jgi:hypothetical protein
MRSLTRAPYAFPRLLAALLVLAATTPAGGQGFQAVILRQAQDVNYSEATGISEDGVVAGYGWEEDEYSPRRGLRWTPAFNYGTVEAPVMDGNLTSVVFNGIDPITDLPFGAAVGPDTGGDVHAIEVDQIAQSQDPFTPDLYHALWTDRHGSGFAESEMLGGVSAYRVGWATPSAGSLPHAAMWDTASGTVHDLHLGDLDPSGYAYSVASAIAGPLAGDGPFHLVVGWSEKQGLDRAMMWTFYDARYVHAIDVHPSGYDSSRAYGASSEWVVGMGSPASSGSQHALRFDASGNATDLNPAWSSYSAALGAGEAGIVGYAGSGPSGRRALYWKAADPNEVTDLHQFLPADYIASHAVALNGAGRIVGTATRPDGKRHAVLWRPVHTFWLIFDPGFITYARVAKAHIVLAKPAPKGGLRIRLSPAESRDAHAWSLQKEVVIAEGETSAAFSVATTEARPPRPVRATITATLGKEVRHATLTINP